MDFTIVAAALAIAVRLHGASPLEPDVLARVHDRVGSILRSSGIDMRWRTCWGRSPRDATCADPPEPDEAVVRLVVGPASESEDACGVALVPSRGPGHFISLFVDCVHRAADRLSLPEDVVLGAVLAHEIGHLLLGTNSHGTIGLMQAQPRPIDWQRATHNALVFTPRESSKLREAIQARMSERR